MLGAGKTRAQGFCQALAPKARMTPKQDSVQVLFAQVLLRGGREVLFAGRV